MAIVEYAHWNSASKISFWLILVEVAIEEYAHWNLIATGTSSLTSSVEVAAVEYAHWNRAFAKEE